MLIKEPKIVCLGGGVGTVQLLRGIRKYTHNITVVVSMADDGGSAGRLRRLYSIPPPGDLINCLAALSNAEPTFSKLLTYRFAGQRWGRDDALSGHKLGSLILVALTKITGDFNSALKEIQKIFRCHGVIYPATNENVSIWAETVEGQKIYGEVNIDLGKYSGKREIREVHLKPTKNTSPKEVITSILEAHYVIAGPGDLYTTILPVLMAGDIQEAIKKTSARKIYVVNIANKPFETPDYVVRDYIDAINKHLQGFPFDLVLVNNNQQPVIPPKLDYHYVKIESNVLTGYNTSLVLKNLVQEDFPLYHDPDKVAKAILENL